jgi:hypothetical protein
MLFHEGAPVRNLNAIGLGLMVGTLAGIPCAMAGPNDITLQRFVTMDSTTNPSGFEIRLASGNEQGFRDLARDIGLIMSPRLAANAETLGISGFSVQLDQSVSLVDNSAEYWRLGAADGDASGSLQTSTLHVRKGLPFSLELGGTVTKMWGSELMGVGTELRWAPLEDFFWPVPDIALRGYVGTVLGDPQLNMILPGWDIVVGVPIGVGGVMNISPFAGYNMSVIIASSRLIDGEPTNPQSAFELRPSNTTPGGTLINYQPEVLFDEQSTVVSQGLFGVRLEFTILNVIFQGTISSAVQSYTTTLGFNF